ncbi:phosphoenolpyruvate--protein phosphotransferase [Acidisoma cellulosilytica]|uniref:Phosphoenolpyruvate-protein phosphotransferase n=1 Tax=Acidisoma cellulosilyticum TaxID=2802395 RepID=A0A963Z109_9PROT|nr:phosphoenolpyruvate--protein phosphotransferase [Acidisoma cellulosilyticum]MCB8880858.1 phosphoenolpyruvate--protein phosphotransferase [Acidisoma cellulosilyticum]
MRKTEQKAAPRPRAARDLGTDTEVLPERLFTGLPIVSGIAVGPAYLFEDQSPVLTSVAIEADAVDGELDRFDGAIKKSRRQLTKLRSQLAMLPAEGAAELEPLLDAYMQMIGPSRLLRGVRKRIESLSAAETAVHDEVEDLAATILAMPDRDRAGLKRRAEEIREIGRRLIRNLTETPFQSFAKLAQGTILVIDTLRPADAALLSPARLAGVVTEEGGTDGHTAVMLRALGIPSILGAEGVTDVIRSGALLVLDGGAGTVTLNPGPATMAAAKRSSANFARERQKLAQLRRLAAETTDGQAVELLANLEVPLELPLIAQAGVEGIGLFRSEFMFMNRAELPDEDEQTEVYGQAVEAMEGDPVTIRVLDWGGEKEIEALQNSGFTTEISGINPALGLRGIRMLLRNPELLETQLAAILRAGARGPVNILLPMVTSIDEVRATRDILHKVVRRLKRRGEELPARMPPLGIMIETPAAALSADALALEADFFAIGTNDLTMYAMAADRGDIEVAKLYDPLHPGLLRLVQFTVEASLRLRKPVSVCGEMAANPKLTPLLLGLGLRALSMNASAVPKVKLVVRSVSIADCARLARRVMEQTEPAEIRALVEEFAEKSL